MAMMCLAPSLKIIWDVLQIVRESYQYLPENILASNDTDPILSDSSVDFNLNSSCGSTESRIPGDILYNSYIKS